MPGRNPRGIAYDAAGRQQYMFYPDNSFQQWDYDETNIIVGYRTVAGRIKRFDKDNRNRINHTWWDPGTDGDTWFEYDQASQLTRAWNANSDIHSTYDGAGRLLTEEQNVAGLGAKTVTYASDRAGKRTALGLVGTPYQFAYHYDPTGRLDQLLNVENTPNGPTASLWFQYLYDQASNVIERYCPMNGVSQKYERDALGRIFMLTVKKATEPRYGTSGSLPGDPPVHQPGPTNPILPPVLGVQSLLAGLTNLTGTAGAPVPTVGTEIASERFSYDALSRLTDVQRNASEGIAPNDHFVYDDSGQLRNATYAGWYGSASRSVNYAQDALGNRNQVNENGTPQGYSPTGNYLNQYAAGPSRGDQ